MQDSSSKTIEKYSNKQILKESDIRCVAFLPNGNVIGGSRTGMLKVWDIKTSECLYEKHAHFSDFKFIFLPNRKLISFNSSHSIMWNIDKLQREEERNYKSNCMAMLPDGRIVSGRRFTYNNWLEVWDMHTNECAMTLEGHGNTILCVAVLPSGKVVSGGADSYMIVWDIDNKKREFSIVAEGEICCIIALPNGIVINGEGSMLRVWDSNSGRILHRLEGHIKTVSCMGVLPNGNIMSGSFDGTLKEWDIKTGQCVSTMNNESEKNSNPVLCMAISPDGKVISSCGKTLKIWINNKLEDKSQIRKVARILAQGYRDRNCFFSILPEEISHKICGLTANPYLYSEEKATKIAKQYFCKPSHNNDENKKRKRDDSDDEKGIHKKQCSNYILDLKK